MINISLINKKISIVALAIIALLIIPNNSYAIPASRAKLARLKNQVDSIDKQIEVIDEEYLESKIKLNKINDQVNLSTQKLTESKKELVRAKKVLGKRVRALYKIDEDSSLDLIFSTKTFNEFVTNLNYINLIGKSDTELVVRVQEIKNEIEQTRKQLKQDQNYQTKLVNRIASKKTAIVRELARKKEIIGSLEADLRAYERARERRALDIARVQSAQQSSVDTSIPVPTNAPRSNVVQAAMKYLGKPYRWGAAGPDSFDCSGLIMRAYSEVGVSLPHSSRAQFGMGQPVPRNALQPGDLVFRGNPIHHVGMYIGNGQMINAPRTGDVVKISPAFTGAYAGARRP